MLEMGVCAFQSTIFNSSLNKVCFAAQHDKHNPNQFMSSGKDRLFIGQPPTPPFIEITPEEVVADNNPRRHEPDHPPSSAGSLFC